MWNNVMVGGIIPGLMAFVASSIIYTLLVLCLAELASAVPFSGGSYSYVRLTIGRNIAIVAGLLQVIG